MNKKIRFITNAGLIAAAYALICLVLKPISMSFIQVRVAEAMCVLPYFTVSAIPGLTIGCLLGNLLSGATLPDIIFGSIATLLGAVGSRLLRRRKYLVAVPPIAFNSVIIPLVLRFSYGEAQPFGLMCLTVGIGEIIACGILGTALLLLLDKYHFKKFIGK